MVGLVVMPIATSVRARPPPRCRAALLLGAAAAAALLLLTGGATASFVAVGNSGTILESAVGEEWADGSLSTFTSTTWADVAFGETPTGDPVWIAVGNAGRMARSTDGGATWTFSTPTTGNLNGIEFDNGRWVAVGTSTRIVTSDNGGVTWQDRSPSSPTVMTFGGVASAGGGLWVAVGNNGLAFRSTDNGNNWESFSTGSNSVLQEVIHDGDRFVAVGSITTGAGATIRTSADGMVWSPPQSINPAHASTLTGVAFGDDGSGGDRWVVVGINSLGNMRTSTDGDNWVAPPAASPSHTSTLQAVAFGRDADGSPRWVAVGVNSNGPIRTSTNGNNWVGVTLPGQVTTMNGVAFGQDGDGGPRWVAVGALSHIHISADGVQWKQVALRTYDARSVEGDGTSWVAGGTLGTMLTRDPVGGWEYHESGATARTYEGIARGVDPAGDPLWVAVGEGTNSNAILSAKVRTNPDPAAGAAWTGRSTPNSNNLNDVAFGWTPDGQPLWVAVGISNTIHRSSNGFTWSDIGGGAGTMNGVAFGWDPDGEPLWVVVGTGNADTKIRTSRDPADGESFSAQAGAPDPNNLNAVAYGRDEDGAPLWVAVGASGTIHRSSDGVAWMDATSTPGSTTLNDVAFGRVGGDRVWVAVGASGTVWRSTDDAQTWNAVQDVPTGQTLLGVQFRGSPLPDLAVSSIEAIPDQIPADGTQPSTIRVTLYTQDFLPTPADGAVVCIHSTLGTLSSGTGGGCAANEVRADALPFGRYQAILEGDGAGGDAVVTARVEGVGILAQTASVLLMTDVASGAQSEISADPPVLPADGVATSAVTVQVRGEFGNDITSGDHLVCLQTTAGTLSSSTGPGGCAADEVEADFDVGDGTYGATLTSDTAAAVALITGTVEGEPIGTDATVEFVEGAPSIDAFTAAGVAFDQILLEWSVTAGGAPIDSIDIERDEAPVTPGPSSTDTDWLDAGLAFDTQFCYRLRVTDSAGVWVQSAEVCASTLERPAAVSVAVGQGGTILLSPDGITWIPQTSGPGVDLHGIAHNGGERFMAVGATGVVRTTTDGWDWTGLTSGTTTQILRGVAHDPGVGANGRWVIAGDGTTAATAAAARMRSSINDGASWSYHAISGTNAQNPQAVAVGENAAGSTLWVAVGNNGMIRTSSDGTAWGTIATSGTTAVLRGVAHGTDGGGNGLWVAVGNTGTIRTSPAGTGTWTTVTGVPLTHLWAVAFATQGPPTWVAVGDAGTILTSSDGTTWSSQTVGDDSLRGVSHDGRQFIAVGLGGTILTSADGLSWQPRQSNTDANLLAIASLQLPAIPPDPDISTIDASPDDLFADGASVSTITVRLYNVEGDAMEAGGFPVCLATTFGTLSGAGACPGGTLAVDNGDGTYTASLGPEVSTGLATVTGSVEVDGVATVIADDATVRFRQVPGVSALSALAVAHDRIDVAWVLTHPEDEPFQHVRVYMGPPGLTYDETTPPSASLAGTAEAYSSTGLPPETTVCFAVRALAADGSPYDSDLPAVACATTLPAPPPPPVLQPIADRTIIAGTTLQFSVQASHAGGLPITLSAAPLPGGSTFDDHTGGTGTFAWQTSGADVGLHTIVFRAEVVDPSAGSSEDTREVTIIVRARPPSSPGGGSGGGSPCPPEECPPPTDDPPTDDAPPDDDVDPVIPTPQECEAALLAGDEETLALCPETDDPAGSADAGSEATGDAGTGESEQEAVVDAPPRVDPIRADHARFQEEQSTTVAPLVVVLLVLAGLVVVAAAGTGAWLLRRRAS